MRYVIGMTLGRRILTRMAELGIRRNTDLTKLMGEIVYPATVGKWISDQDEPSGSNLLALAKALQTTPEYLLYGVETELQEWEDKDAPPLYIISYAEAGEVRELDQRGYPIWTGHETIPRPRELEDMKAFVVIARGDSMSPAIEEGWQIIIAPSYQVKNKDFVLAKDGSQNVKLRKLKFEGEIVQLYSVNSAYAPEIYQKKDLKFLYKVWAILPR